MKRIIVQMLVVLIMLSLAGCNTVSVKEDAQITIGYTSSTISFTDELTPEEVELVISVLDGKKMTSDMVKCTYNGRVYFVIDGVKYIMCDLSCTTLKNCEEEKYIDISGEERELLESVFISRGGTFPVR